MKRTAKDTKNTKEKRKSVNVIFLQLIYEYYINKNNKIKLNLQTN
jgi:hypothetical protein